MKNINKNGTFLFFLMLSLVFSACQQAEKKLKAAGNVDRTGVSYDEPYRPQFHFTPQKNWMNDPNGLVYHEEEYHLFYQHNPFGNTWGHMSWGHAVSSDLVHWEHLPVALKEENNVMIFSGSAVVDHNNTSGFGSDDNPPMVAIYTGHHTDRELQDQRIAYSTDNGRTWTKYKSNPVLDEGLENFRDPKVFWHDASDKWVMVVALPTEYKVRFYGSANLKDWTMLSEFGPAGNTDGIWECPDLFELPVDGDDKQSQWVLQVDTNPGGPFGGSGSQYFLGSFDGESFTRTGSDSKEKIRWVDYGKDFYAVQSFANIPEEDGRRIWISWMNNWQYAEQIPTNPWRSAMTIPRSLSLKSFEDGIHLVHQPVKELQKLRSGHHHFGEQKITGTSEILEKAEIRGNQLELTARFKAGAATDFGFKVARGEAEETVIGYNAKEQELYVDRTRSGKTGFSDAFSGIHKAPLQPVDGEIKLHIFVDRSSVEVFGNNGRVVITDRIFPAGSSDGISLFAEGGAVQLVSMDIWELNAIWN